VSTVVWG